ncbi:efflux RND transporter periplasmic adaptor subunit [Ramlibacter albus]|uniref:Efflux RND transporter periplasmic adaptor subunit n=1 Tax=Ramlibacter albus TaxID=2079448 RepID=A0A923M7B6_9BURK|nr:efflux RND transporter periplasmic adaptor subunit [Ramlibacter albus]MBC5764054.1 efflux RND transporter periplasmic adaptor subunit [Ramlibacter albus]
MKILTSLTCAALVGAMLLAGCREAEVPAEAAQPKLVGNQFQFPTKHPHLAQFGLVAAAPARAISVDLPARIVWNEDRTQRIYPAFAGRVSRIAVDLGQPVKPGAVLAQLASPDFGAAQADAAKAHADASLSQKALARQRELFDAGIIARKDLDQAEADAARSQAEVQRAAARTRLYGGGVSVNQALALTAGIAGTVVERNLTPGQELRPEQMGPGVPPLFVISDPTTLWVMIDARESEADTLRPGATFELSVPALPNQKFEGKVTAAADYIDPATRTIKVRGVIANPDRKLKAEMLATARVERSVGSGVLVPAQAVSLRGAKHFVMVQVQPGAFEPREVVLGWQGPKEVLVKQGLEAGELVVGENVLLLARQYRTAQETAKPASAP